MGDRRPRTVVLGLGNVLMRDDALGPHVIAELQANYDFGPDVMVEDLGTPGLDLVPFVSDCDSLLIVDTVRATGNPGELKLYGRDEILQRPVQARVSPHDPGVREAILATEFARQVQLDLSLVGVIPGDTSQGIGLTPEVAAALPAARDALLDALLERGLEFRAKAHPMPLELWWQKGSA